MKPRSKDIDRGWAWVVVACSFLIHLMCYGLAWSTGVYNVIFLEEFGQPKYITAWAGSLPTAVLYGIGPVASMLSNKYGFRPMIMIGSALTCVGLCLSYFAENLYTLFFTLGVVAGAGLGITFVPSIAAVSCYFDEKINLASGLASSGVGAGNFLYPAIIRWLVNIYDWRQSFLILGAISLNMCVFGALIRPIKRTEISKDQPILNITPFKKKGYLMLCLNVFLVCFGMSSLFIHLSAYGERTGLSSDESAALISGLGAANLLGRIGYGFVANRFRIDVFILYSVSFAFAGVCVCLVPVMKSFPVLMSISVSFGIFSGCFGSLLVKILIELLGLHRFANGYGCLLLFMAAGQLTGASATGAMFDVTGSYTLTFLLGGALIILSSLAMIYPYVDVKRRSRQWIIEEEMIAEKEALAGYQDIKALEKLSHRSLVQMTVSLESLAAAKQTIDAIRHSTKSLILNATRSNRIETIKGTSGLVHKDVATLRLLKEDTTAKMSYSAETI